MKNILLWIMAKFRLDDDAICWMARGTDPWNDIFHDWPDDERGYPDHFCINRCKRCGKEFMI